MMAAGRCVRRCGLGFAMLAWIAAAAQAQPAPGDCDGDGMVTIDELTRAVAIALGSQPLAACPAADADGNQRVEIAELIAAVRFALEQMPQPTPTGSPAATGTATAVATGAATSTATATGAASATRTATSTASATGVASSTRTATPTAAPANSATATATPVVPTATPTTGFRIIDIGDAFNQVGGIVPFCVELFEPEDVETLTIDLCLSADVFVVDGVQCSADLFECPISIDPESVAVSPTEHFATCELGDGEDPRGQVRARITSATASTALPLGTILGCTVQVRSDALPGVYPVQIRATAERLGGETLVGIDTANANVSALGPGGDCLGDAQCDPPICRERCCACACDGTCDNFGECSTAPCFGQ